MALSSVLIHVLPPLQAERVSQLVMITGIITAAAKPKVCLTKWLDLQSMHVLNGYQPVKAASDIVFSAQRDCATVVSGFLLQENVELGLRGLGLPEQAHAGPIEHPPAQNQASFGMDWLLAQLLAALGKLAVMLRQRIRGDRPGRPPLLPVALLMPGPRVEGGAGQALAAAEFLPHPALLMPGPGVEGGGGHALVAAEFLAHPALLMPADPYVEGGAGQGHAAAEPPAAHTAAPDEMAWLPAWDRVHDEAYGGVLKMRLSDPVGCTRVYTGVPNAIAFRLLQQGSASPLLDQAGPSSSSANLVQQGSASPLLDQAGPSSSSANLVQPAPNRIGGS